MNKLLLAAIALSAMMYTPSVIAVSSSGNEGTREGETRDFSETVRAFSDALNKFHQDMREVDEREKKTRADSRLVAIKGVNDLAAEFVSATALQHYRLQPAVPSARVDVSAMSVELHRQVLGEQTIPRQLDLAIADLLEVFAELQSDGTYKFSEAQTIRAFAAGENFSEAQKTIIKTFVRSMSTARRAYEKAKETHESAFFGRRSAEESVVSNAIADQIEVYLRFCKDFGPFVSNLKDQGKRIFDKAWQEYDLRLRSGIDAAMVAKMRELGLIQ